MSRSTYYSLNFCSKHVYIFVILTFLATFLPLGKNICSRWSVERRKKEKTSHGSKVRLKLIPQKQKTS